MSLFPQSQASAAVGKTSIRTPNRWSAALAFLLSAFVLFAHLGALPLITPDEGRNAEVAREMNQSHSWLVPTYDGLTYLDKPAFYFKTVALSFGLFGESEGTARLSSALFGFSLLVALFLFCRRVYDERTAILAMLTVALTPLYIAFSRIVIFDMTLAFFVCTAIFACYLAEEAEGRRRSLWYLAGALASGVATLVKGPVGFIIPTLVIAVFNRFEGRKGAMKRAFAPLNWAVFLAVVLPWFIGLSLLRPDFPYYGIVKESISRFTTTEFHRTAPFYYYALIIASCFFAWSLLLPESIVAAWRSRSRWSRPDRLFVVWSIVVVVFFSLSQSKLPGYILTALVALGVLTARLFASALENRDGRAARIVLRASLALLVLSATAGVALGVFISDAEHMADVRHKLFELFLPTLPPLALSLGGVAALAGLARWTRDTRIAFAAFLSLPLLLVTVNFDLLTLYAQTRSSRDLAQSIPALPPDTEIACLRCLPNGLPFYLKRLVTVVSDDGGELTSNYVLFTLNSSRTWPERIVPQAQMDQWLANRDHPIYLLAKERDLAQLRSVAESHGVPLADLGSNYWAALLPVPGKN